MQYLRSIPESSLTSLTGAPELRSCRQLQLPNLSRPTALTISATQTHSRAFGSCMSHSGGYVFADGRWRLYYAGRSADGSWTGIGLALTDQSNDVQLEGVNIGFKRRQTQ